MCDDTKHREAAEILFLESAQRPAFRDGTTEATHHLFDTLRGIFHRSRQSPGDKKPASPDVIILLDENPKVVLEHLPFNTPTTGVGISDINGQ